MRRIGILETCEVTVAYQHVAIITGTQLRINIWKSLALGSLHALLRHGNTRFLLLHTFAVLFDHSKHLIDMQIADRLGENHGRKGDAEHRRHHHFFHLKK